MELIETLPAPLPVPVATLLGLEAPRLKLKISILFSKPLACDSPGTPSMSKNISTAINLLLLWSVMMLIRNRPADACLLSQRPKNWLLGRRRQLGNEPQRDRQFVQLVMRPHKGHGAVRPR